MTRVTGRAAAVTQAVADRLFVPVDIASLAVFRAMFGLIMLWETWRYASKDWIGALYVEPGFFFAYPGFAWVRPWPGTGMYWHFALLATLALLIAVGLFYRQAIVLFFFAFAYLFLIDQALYLNHFYLVGLVAFLMMFVPAARGWSLDALLRGRGWRSTVPSWSVWLLVLQFEVVYLFAGLVKINPDWLRLEPLGEWLAEGADLPLVGPLLLERWVVAVAAYGAIALHVLGAPLLLFRATRAYAFAAYCVFHLANAVLWPIGIFPWFTIAGTLLFFDPGWPRTFARAVRRGVARLRPLVGAARARAAGLLPAPAAGPRARVAVVALIGAWIAVQVLVPLRFLAYPGNVSWTEQGHKFAWQMMLRDKDGETVFVVEEPATGRRWEVHPHDHLTDRQAGYMAGRPEMMRRFAHHLEARWAAEHGTGDVEVRALSAVSLNGRPAQPLVDPARDLTRIGYSLRAADWILPLEQPLPPVEERWKDDIDEVLAGLLAADRARAKTAAR